VSKQDIRLMTFDDMSDVVARIQEAGIESGWSEHLEFDGAYVADQTAIMIVNDDYLVIGTDDVSAIMIASIKSCWYTPSLQANEMIFYARPDSRRNGNARELVKEYIKWATAKGAQKINISVNLNVQPEAGCALCESLGFVETGYSFTQ